MAMLNIDRKTLYTALKYLEENVLVLETRIDGQSEFMVNPNYVTVGRDKKARMTEWNNRWIQHWKEVHSQKGSVANVPVRENPVE